MNNRPICKMKILRLLEENVQEILCDLRLGKYFLDMTPKSQSSKGSALQ